MNPLSLDKRIGAALSAVLCRIETPAPDLALTTAILELDALEAPIEFDDARREQVWGEIVELAAEYERCCDWVRVRQEVEETPPPAANGTL